jgi:hypothetical protein
LKIGFSEGIENQLNVTALRLWRLASIRGKLAYILFGPALMLVPRLHQKGECTDSAKICFKVRGVDFNLTTDFKESTAYSTRLSRPVPLRETLD